MYIFYINACVLAYFKNHKHTLDIASKIKLLRLTLPLWLVTFSNKIFVVKMIKFKMSMRIGKNETPLLAGLAVGCFFIPFFHHHLSFAVTLVLKYP